MSRRLLGAFTLLGALWMVCWICGSCHGADAGPTAPAEKLLRLGTISPEPIKFSVWTNKPAGQKFKTGDRVVIYFKADKDCYVTALNVSTRGDVVVLFPSKEHPDNFVKAGRQYSLFDDDSSVRLEMGKGLPEVKAVFYVTSEPVSLAPLTISDDRLVLQIPHDTKESLDVIAGKIEKASASAGFNRVVLAIKSDSAEGPRLKLMGPVPKERPIQPESEPPESLTGTQGVKPAEK